MKSPRDILLKRHQAAAPKLDAIRREVVKTELREGRRAAVPKFRVADTATLPILIWRELILPSRRIWAGLAATWLLIAVAHISMTGHSRVQMAKTSPSPEMILAYRQQERLLAELIGANEPRIAERPKLLPRPRSERRPEILTA